MKLLSFLQRYTQQAKPVVEQKTVFTPKLTNASVERLIEGQYVEPSHHLFPNDERFNYFVELIKQRDQPLFDRISGLY
jgi:hypothetical protein